MIRIRTIALASPLFFLLGAAGCGGAASSGAPPKEMTAQSGAPDTRGVPDGDGDEAAPPTTGAGAPDEGGVQPAPPPVQGATEMGGRPRGAEIKDKDGAPAQAVVDSGSTALGGRLTQQDIADILSKNAGLFNDCYTIGAGKSQSFTGVVTVKATLGPSGNVTVAEVVKSTAKNQKVDTCVVQAFKKIKFPAPRDGGTSVITFPMEFNGVEQIK
jgi:TonB family protein